MKTTVRLAVLLGALMLPPAEDPATRRRPRRTMMDHPPAPVADGTLHVEPGRPAGPASIDDALASAGSEPLFVNGALFVDAEGTMLLCSAIAESFPPQCGGTRLQVARLDISSIPRPIQEANGVQWASRCSCWEPWPRPAEEAAVDRRIRRASRSRQRVAAPRVR